MHESPGTAVPLAAITGSRKDWAALKSRGNADAKLGDHGRWDNLGPDNAVYPLNPSGIGTSTSPTSTSLRP